LNKYTKVAEAKKEEKKTNPWDEANLLSNQKNEGVYITTVAEQRYIYREYTIRRARVCDKVSEGEC
jgi:hypothetical protein